MKKILILGAGQLGWMLTKEFNNFGYEVKILDDKDEVPKHIKTITSKIDWNDFNTLIPHLYDVDYVTWEVEHININIVKKIQQHGIKVIPNPSCLEILQNRYTQKLLLDELNIPTAKWKKVNSFNDLYNLKNLFKFPFVIKSCLGGYDGRGQVVVKNFGDFNLCKTILENQCILEEFIEFDDECSIVSAYSDFNSVHWNVVENQHQNGILIKTISPHQHLSNELQLEAEDISLKIANRLGYKGVIAIEFFRIGKKLYVNEIAPRVHNSGHWSLDGSITSQFENHARCVLGLEASATHTIHNTIMLNCIGKMVIPENGENKLRIYDYGKEEKTGRKVGHINVIKV